MSVHRLSLLLILCVLVIAPLGAQDRPENRIPYDHFIHLFKNRTHGDVLEIAMSPDEKVAQAVMHSDGFVRQVQEEKFGKKGYKALIQTIDNFFHGLDKSYWSEPAESIVRDDTIYEVTWKQDEKAHTIVTDDRTPPDRLKKFMRQLRDDSIHWKDTKKHEAWIQALPINCPSWSPAYPKRQFAGKTDRELLLSRVHAAPDDPVSWDDLPKEVQKALERPFFFMPFDKKQELFTDEVSEVYAVDEEGRVFLVTRYVSKQQ